MTSGNELMLQHAQRRVGHPHQLPNATQRARIGVRTPPSTPLSEEVVHQRAIMLLRLVSANLCRAPPPGSS